MFDSSAPDDEAGFTLLEMVVAMSLFGMLTVLCFGLMQTAMKTQAYVVSSVQDVPDTARAMSAVASDIRLAPEARASENGEVLYLRTQDDKVVVWEITDEGLTNGARTFKQIKEAHFEAADGSVSYTVESTNGYEESGTTASRFEQGEALLTDGFLSSRGVLR